MNSRRSTLPLVGAFLLVVVPAVVVVALGAPAAGVVPLVVGVGGAMLTKAAGDRRFDRAEAFEPGGLDQYPIRLPVDRWAVGSPWQFRLLPATRRAWAPGILGVEPGAARFVPTTPAKADLAWSGQPTAVEIITTWRVCCVRFHTVDGVAQFSIQQSAASVRELLAPRLPVTTD